jgi:hypothetical protein
MSVTRPALIAHRLGRAYGPIPPLPHSPAELSVSTAVCTDRPAELRAELTPREATRTPAVLAAA